MKKPILNISELDLSKQYTYADYLTWQFSERVELIKGWIKKMSPAPKRKHQRVVSQLHGLIWSHINKSDYIALLNQDTIVEANWLLRLVKTAESKNDCSKNW